MARLPRSSFPAAGVWHVTTRGVEQRRVFLDAADGRAFLDLLRTGLAGRALRPLALCLMPNHYHLVAEGSRDALSYLLHGVNGGYASAFNAKYGRSGHLWGDRFRLWLLRDDDHLRATCIYVVANPVRARLCAAPADWPWSWSRYGRRR